ncbi:uncharacterized protein B0I36DRAFT_339947 [Microdochium trichocladiopsis]|uniref:Uncharacterized protein n=1 Tax=Microdochium trichocladiopsis TaxID=1682393 RepID=A0A9P8XRK8_9PEZI|nr:uncharacterized protein B0I36DRAFT_339947 [Microdochium trichocladiopsis]KAH7012632.1 hypothetical protein B0I36DRAFT_339947 [Microdochium trichocladiopsis]
MSCLAPAGVISRLPAFLHCFMGSLVSKVLLLSSKSYVCGHNIVVALFLPKKISSEVNTKQEHDCVELAMASFSFFPLRRMNASHDHLRNSVTFRLTLL